MKIKRKEIESLIIAILSKINIAINSTCNDSNRPAIKRLQPLLFGLFLFLIVISIVIAIATWFEFNRQKYIEETYGDNIEQKLQNREISLLGFSREKMNARYKAAFNTFEQDIYSSSLELISDCKDTPICHVVVLYKYLNENFKVSTAEYIGEKPLKQPIETWIDKAGTTEDLSVLYASMLYGLGHELCISLAPREAFVTFYNFKSTDFLEEIIFRYRSQYGIIKATKIDLKSREKHHLKIDGDYRYYPLTLDITSTGLFDIRFYHSSDEYRRFREGITAFVDREYDRNGVAAYKKEIFMDKGSIIVLENQGSPATVLYTGYRNNDEETHRYIESLITIHKGDGSRYSCHTPLVFSLGENHLPGRETKYISDTILSDGIIEIPVNVMTGKFLKQVKNPVK